ncbi:hypothetical protein [Novipirellula caenicola]|uniref:ROS/MUCR transcriptional regulator protein n=1 Tax=Novipirellula caenicola TaxID=1536901 RepID=A0ABP9VYV2_9BACT
MTEAKPKTTGCRVCGADVKTRGLCDKHYRRYSRRLKSMPEAEREAFEERCIADGWVLPLTKGGRPKEDADPFADIAAEVHAEAIRNQVPGVEPAANKYSAEEIAAMESDQAEIERVSRQEKTRQASKKKSTPGARRKKSG